ncbi:hypothetical protein N9I50_00755, partial [bacterium]|nr:hypothetical protein [bacterium]
DRPDTSPTADLGLQLAQLAHLHGQGVLSDEEFSAAKQRIINEKPRQETGEPPALKPTPGPFDETGHRIVTEKPDAKTRWKAEIDHQTRRPGHSMRRLRGLVAGLLIGVGVIAYGVAGLLTGIGPLVIVFGEWQTGVAMSGAGLACVFVALLFGGLGGLLEDMDE